MLATQRHRGKQRVASSARNAVLCMSLHGNRNVIAQPKDMSGRPERFPGLGIHAVLAAWCPALAVRGRGDVRGTHTSSKAAGLRIHDLALGEAEPGLRPSAASASAHAVREALAAHGLTVVAREVAVQSPDRSVSTTIDAVLQEGAHAGTTLGLVCELKTGGGGTGRRAAAFVSPLGPGLPATPLGFATAQAAAGLFMAMHGTAAPLPGLGPWTAVGCVVVTVTGTPPVVTLRRDGEGVLASPDPALMCVLGRGVVAGRGGAPGQLSADWTQARTGLRALAFVSKNTKKRACESRSRAPLKKKPTPCT